jgi:hypothetical protein
VLLPECRPAFMLEEQKGKEKSQRIPENFLDEFYEEYIDTGKYKDIKYVVYNSDFVDQSFPKLEQYYKMVRNIRRQLQ